MSIELRLEFMKLLFIGGGGGGGGLALHFKQLI